MIKTNSKKAREKIRAYIMNNAPEIEDNAAPDFNAVAAYIISDFERVIENDYRVGRMTYQDLFFDYSQGLPLDGLFLYHDRYNAVDTLGDILEETETERARYSEDKAAYLFTYLIYRECLKAIER